MAHYKALRLKSTIVYSSEITWPTATYSKCVAFGWAARKVPDFRFQTKHFLRDEWATVSKMKPFVLHMLPLMLSFLVGLTDQAHLLTKRADLSANFVNLIQSTPFKLDKGMNDFNAKLFDVISQVNDKNIVVSPFSLHNAMSLVVVGAPNESNTYRELATALFGTTDFSVEYLFNYLKVLNFYSTQTRETKIKFANKAFAAEDLKIRANYTDYLITFFHTTLQRVEFDNAEETVKIINDFVSDVTNGLIDEVVQQSSFNAMTRMVLINAIYFKANWLHKFNKESTQPMKFTVRPGLELDYPHGMSMRRSLPTADMTASGFPAQVVALPYESPDFRMLLILPNLDEKIENLSLSRLDMGLLDASLDENMVILLLPRLKLEFESKMMSPLNKMGINDLFDDGKADLRDISESENLHVSDVIHKAVVEINEEGSEAAAVSAVQIDTRSGGLQTPVKMMKFDRPFFFMIQDTKHRIPLFVGRVTDPTGVNGLGLGVPRQDELVAALEEDTVPCDSLGFSTLAEGPDSKINFPCKTQETFPLREKFE